MLTCKHVNLLKFIHIHLQKDGIPPSFEGMKKPLGLRSRPGIHRLITALEDRGFIRRLAHKARAIEIMRLPKIIEPGPAPRVIKADRSAPGAPPDRSWSWVVSLPA